MNIILLGPPGAGKGTQARLIQDRHHLALISTGDILRENVKERTPIGLLVKKTIEEGGFPSDDIILQIFEERLRQVKGQGVILDGIPRTLNQAQKVDDIFDHLGRSLDVVIQLAVDDEELIKRLSNRMICKSCGTPYTLENPPRVEGICDRCAGSEFTKRLDDEPEAVKTRLDVYNEQTKPLILYYSKANRLQIVNGMQSVQAVNTQIESILEKLTRDSGCLYSAQDI